MRSTREGKSVKFVKGRMGKMRGFDLPSFKYQACLTIEAEIVLSSFGVGCVYQLFVLVVGVWY